jgi:hypothetical protein
MSVRPLLAGLLLAACAVTPALAQDSLPAADMVAAVFIGFADAATVEVMGSEVATISQTGPGVFGGTVSPGEFTFTVTEPADCVFEGRFAVGDQAFTAAFNLAEIDSIRFSEPEAMAGYTRYKVELTGAEGAVETIADDGTRSDAGMTSPIGTSIPLADLDAAAAALLELCSAE